MDKIPLEHLLVHRMEPAEAPLEAVSIMLALKAQIGEVQPIPAEECRDILLHRVVGEVGIVVDVEDEAADEAGGVVGGTDS